MLFQEKVKFSAHRLQKEDQTLNYQRKIEALEKKIELLQKPSFEKLQVIVNVIHDLSSGGGPIG